MTTIDSFVNRLKKIGIEVTFKGNIPWIYLDTVNGLKVTDRYEGNHGFTAFWYGVRSGSVPRISDITEVFKQIRKKLNEQRANIH